MPMLQRVIETAQAALPPDESGGEPRSRITVVLGAHAEAVQAGVIERLAPPRPNVVVCPDWERGIAHSLRCGLAELEATPADAAMIMLGDTPYIVRYDLQKLIDGWRTSPEIPSAAAYDGVVGAPCILPRKTWSQMMELEGDRGAGAWLKNRSISGLPMTIVAIPNALRDMDWSPKPD